MGIRVAIDTDIGDDIDDALALALAARSPELELVAVTTVYGDVETRARLAAKLLEALGRDVPVAPGSSKPLYGEAPGRPPIYSTALGSGDSYSNIVERHAVDLLEELVEGGGVDVIITLGPLTNLALLFMKRPDLVGRVRLVTMGGAYSLNTAEYNIRCDPEAARAVISASCDKVLVGLDVTLKCVMSDEMLRELYAGGEEYKEVLAAYTRAWRAWAGHNPILHDPLAVAVSFNRGLVSLEPAHVEVEVQGRYTRGYTVITDGEPNAEVCREVDVEAFLRLFRERVL